MTPEQRLHYLDAMGIQLWMPNDAVVDEASEVAAAAAEVAPPVAEAPVAPPPVEPNTPSPVQPPVQAPRPAVAEAPPPLTDAAPPALDEPPPWDAPPPYVEGPQAPPTARPPVESPAAPPAREPAPKPTPRRPQPPAAPEPRHSVGEGVDWAALESMVRDCTQCELHATRTHPVFGVGDRQADWMVIGEAPGRDEDLQGEPFVGRAGKLLNAMLWAAGFPREQVFIANILKSRPPNNRDPHVDEVAACIPYLLRQIELIQPKMILAVGRIAAQNLLQTEEAIGRLRGRVHTLRPYGIPVIATYHPAYLLRTPSQKRRAWDDLKLALRVYGAGR